MKASGHQGRKPFFFHLSSSPFPLCFARMGKSIRTAQSCRLREDANGPPSLAVRLPGPLRHEICEKANFTPSLGSRVSSAHAPIARTAQSCRLRNDANGLPSLAVRQPEPLRHEICEKANFVPSLGALVASARSSIAASADAVRHRPANIVSGRHCQALRVSPGPSGNGGVHLVRRGGMVDAGPGSASHLGGAQLAPPAGSPPAARRADHPHVSQTSLTQGRRAA